MRRALSLRTLASILLNILWKLTTLLVGAHAFRFALSRQFLDYSINILLAKLFEGVTCGPRADLFCFRCGDFVYHEVFEQEKERIAITQHFPWMSWKLNPVQRSFDPLQFLTTPEHGVVWRGLVATYPNLLPDEYLAAVNRSMDRLLMFKGELESKKMIWGQEALRFATHQNLLGKYRAAVP